MHVYLIGYATDLFPIVLAVPWAVHAGARAPRREREREKGGAAVHYARDGSACQGRTWEVDCASPIQIILRRM